jgi:two-component system sensor histidine kinase DegS
VTLDKSGVEPAIREFLLQNHSDDRMTVKFTGILGSDRLAPVLESSLFRIVQEAVNNARRHSRSSRVNVVLSKETDSVRVAIEDWGTGFDPDAVPEGRFGLEGIRERARLLGGEALIDSTPGAGTRIVVTLPLSIPSSR